MSDALECIVVSAVTSETKANGEVRKVTLLLPNEPGDHPFRGLIGQRLHIVVLRLNDDETKAPVEPKPPPAPVGPITGRNWVELKLSVQAALRCNDPEFARFLSQRTGLDIVTADEAATIVRNHCAVQSRAELNTSEQAAKAWRELDDAFFKWQRGMR